MIVNGACTIEQNPLFENPRRHKEAKAICATCPSVNACLKFAIRNDDFEVTTVYGGLNGKERKALVMSGGVIL